MIGGGIQSKFGRDTRATTEAGIARGAGEMLLRLRTYVLSIMAFMVIIMPFTTAAQPSAASADMSVTISPKESQVEVGSEVVLTSTFTNNGPDAAVDVRLIFEWWNLDEYKFVSATSSTGTIVRMSGFADIILETIELPVMASGESVTMTVTLLTRAEASPGFYAYIESNVTADSNPANNTDDAHIIAGRQPLRPGVALWDVSSTAFTIFPGFEPSSGNETYVNNDVIYEVTFKNTGPAELTSITLDNYLFAEGIATNLRTDIVATGAVSGVQSAGIDYTIQSMAPGSSIVFRFTYTLLTAGWYGMETVSTAQQSIPDRPEILTYSAINVKDGEQQGLADVSFNISADRTEIPFGENAVVRVAVTNNGPDPAYDVRCSFSGMMFNRNVDYISTESTADPVELYLGGSLVDSGARFRVPVLNPGQTETMTLVFRIKHFGQVTAWANIGFDSAKSIDPNYSNNSTEPITLNTTGEPPVFDLQANITASAATAQPSGLLVYNMAITNVGPDDMPSTITLSNVWAKLTYPQWGLNGPMGPLVIEDGDVEFYSIQDEGQWSLNFNNQGLMASLPYLAAGDTANLVLVYSVSPNAVGDELGNINNSIVVRHELFESNTDNNSATVSTPISVAGGPESDILVTQTGSAQAAVLNQPVSISVTALNMGPNPTNGTFLGSLIPGGVSINSITSNKGVPVLVNKYASVSNVPLAVGEAVTMTVNVTPTQVGQFSSYSAGSSDMFDPDVANNYSEKMTLVVETPPVVVPPVEEPPVANPPTVVPPIPNIPCTDPVDLAAQMLKIRSKGKVKKKTGEWQFKVQAKVGVTNLGTECAPRTVVKLYLSDDLTVDSSDLLLGVKSMKAKCPGKNNKKAKKVNFKMKLDSGINPTGRYLIAVADGDNNVPECNEANNNAVAF